MSATIHTLKPELGMLRCTVCHTSTEAPCGCGAPYEYIAPGKLAAAAIKKNPGDSDRAIARKIGVNVMTVGRARKSTVTNVTVEEPRLGLDGKKRKLPKPRIVSDDERDLRPRFLRQPDEGDSDEVCWRRGLLYRAATAAGGALFEDWSHYSVDAELVSATRQAAKAWTAVADYIERLANEQSKKGTAS